LDFENLELSIGFKNSSGVNIFLSSLSEKFGNELLDFKKGKYQAVLKVDGHFLMPDNYYISTYIHLRNHKNIDYNEDVLKINIVETGSQMAPYGASATNFACVFGKTSWI